MTDIDPVTESLIFERLRELKDTTDIDESNLTPIQEFYKDAKIFITGCTGFLGQVLIEKLLRSCPVSTLYLLVREKKGKSAETRLDEIFEAELFTGLRKFFPDFRKKVVVVEGDCQLPELGLSDQDKGVLKNEVNVVFHVAATVRFDAALNTATTINVVATRDLSVLAQQMQKLKAFVQVSTIYGNSPEDTIEEKIYPPAMKPHHLMQICRYIDQVLLDMLTPHFKGLYPNTYAYTKQIAEDVIKKEGKDLPAAIYRPAIVVSTYKEPVRGWINNIYGATGALFGSGLGVLRVLYIDPQVNANLVPVDMCINGLVASAWDVSQRFEKAKEGDEEYEVVVYNYENSNDKPITWRHFQQLAWKYCIYTPSVKAIWFYVSYIVKSRSLYLTLAFLLHTIPGVIIDVILFCQGKKMRMVKVYQNIHKFSSAISYFGLKNFVFQSENVRNMLEQMSAKDKEVFLCDFKELDWDEFFSTYISGGRLYLLKDPLETLPDGRRRFKKLKIAHVTLKLVLWFLGVTIIWCLLSFAYKTAFI